MSETGSGLRAECRYGPVVQGVALSLMNTTNAAINKVPLFLSGMTGGEVCPSEGYVAKLMKKAAYYVAHDKKDMDSVIEDGVLDALAEGTAVMHDHNRINYNDRFAFTNVECNAHLQRDLQKIVDETGHNSFRKLKGLISATIKERNDLVKEGKAGFERSYIEDFERRLTEAVTEAETEAEGNTSVYSGPFEQAVIRRVKE